MKPEEKEVSERKRSLKTILEKDHLEERLCFQGFDMHDGIRVRISFNLYFHVFWM